MFHAFKQGTVSDQRGIAQACFVVGCTSDPRRYLGVLDQVHEAEIHVKLGVTVEQGESRIIGHEIDFSRAERVYHNDILGYASRELAGKIGDFKTVPVQVQRMGIAAFVAKVIR